MKAKNAAFNWSDEELLSDMDDTSHIRYKDKYHKKKSRGQAAYSSLKRTVAKGYQGVKNNL